MKEPRNNRDTDIGSAVENTGMDTELKRIRRALEIIAEEEVTAKDVD